MYISSILDTKDVTGQSDTWLKVLLNIVMTTIQDIRKQKDNDIPTFYTIELQSRQSNTKITHVFRTENFSNESNVFKFLVPPKHAGSPDLQKCWDFPSDFPDFSSISQADWAIGRATDAASLLASQSGGVKHLELDLR